MKHLIFLLLSFISLDGLRAQKVKYDSLEMKRLMQNKYLPTFDSTGKATQWQGDSTFSVQLVSENSNVKVYNGTLPEAAKYGHTIGTNMMRGRDTLEWPWDMPPPVPKGEGPIRRAILLKDLSSIDPVSVFGFPSDTMSILNPNSLWQAMNYADSMRRSLWPPFPKLDTIGPQLRQVSDSGKGWNPVSAVWVYEVRVYENVIKNATGNRQDGLGLSLPEHFMWLDSNKKSLKLKVWDAQ